MENPVNRLNERCLKHIFQFLPLQDRIRMERVCKIWQKTSRGSWYRMKTIDLSFSLWGFTHRKIPMAILLGLVQHRCDEFLTRIDLSNLQANSLGERIEGTAEYRQTMSTIIERCPNLEDIDFTSLLVYNIHLQKIGENCRNIIKLKLGLTLSHCDRELLKIFRANPNLKHFQIKSNALLNKCLLFLSIQNMRTIILQTCQFKVPTVIVDALERLEHLKHLTLYKCTNVPKNILEVVGTHCRSLTKLEFICNSRSNHTVHSLTNLANLKILKIHNNSNTSDAFLADLVLHCVHLTYIDISSCNNVTDIGLADIARLEELEKLILNYLNQITGSGLQNMHRLKELHCRRCKLDDENISTFIESSSRLQLLNIAECQNITNITLQAAINVCNNRFNNNLVTMIVEGTQIGLREEMIIPRNLNLIGV